MFTMIAAMAENRTIGRDNDLPWRLSADLKRFKQVTTGQAIIMGRKTWESLGRPLPKRRNIVITRNKEFSAEGADVCNSLEEAAALAGDLEAIIIGGAEIYKLALPQANRLFLTHVKAQVEGDAFFPEFAADDWELAGSEEFSADEKNEFDFTFCEYRRKSDS